MRTRSGTLALSASLLIAATAYAQPDPHPVYRVVWLDGAPGLNVFASVHLREDDAVIISNNPGFYIGSRSIPWTQVPELELTAIGDVNASGQICGTKRLAPLISLPFIATPTPEGTYDTIDYLPLGSYQSAVSATGEMDIADDGTVVGTLLITSQTGDAVIWSPGANTPLVLTSGMSDFRPSSAHAISPSGTLITGHARLQPFNRRVMYLATGPNAAVEIENTNFGDYITFTGITDDGVALVPLSTDTFDGLVEIWRIQGSQRETVKIVGFAHDLLLRQPRMSLNGRALVHTDRLVTWYDDGTPDGAVLEVEARLWTDTPPALNFAVFGGDINDRGVIAIKATPPGGTEGIALLIPTCRADVNADGSVDASDFDAWIAAYHSGSHRADQNADGLITPADFTAWLAGYSAGCNLN